MGGDHLTFPNWSSSIRRQCWNRFQTFYCIWSWSALKFKNQPYVQVRARSRLFSWVESWGRVDGKDPFFTEEMAHAYSWQTTKYYKFDCYSLSLVSSLRHLGVLKVFIDLICRNLTQVSGGERELRLWALKTKPFNRACVESLSNITALRWDPCYLLL